MNLVTRDEPSAPRGYCQCGCGALTRIPTQTKGRFVVKGVPLRYLPGHHQRVPRRDEYIVDEHGCWIWQGGLFNTGYAMGAVNGRTTVAHRISYERFKGPIPEGLEIDHLCHVKACVNPDHLEAVTHTENQRRRRCNKLTLEKAREIRALSAAGESQASIASRYGVARETVRAIQHGRIWREAA